MAKIYAPNKGYAGKVAGVSFVNGEGKTGDKWLIQWFKNKGYKVVEEEIEEEKVPEDEREETIETDLESLKVEELREMAKEKNIEGYSKMKKEKLINALRGE
jgi:hypothetical protein